MSSQGLGGLWASPSELCPVTPPSQGGVALGLQLSAAWECREVHRAPGQFWAYPLPPKSFVSQSWNWPFLEAFFLVSFCGWVTGSHCSLRLAWGTCADQASLQLVVRFVSDSDCWFYRQELACSEHCPLSLRCQHNEFVYIIYSFCFLRDFCMVYILFCR